MRATFTDSAGVTVVVNPQQGWIASGSWSVAPSPTLDIGGSVTDSNRQFFRIESSLRLADGSIVVANAGTHQLRYYDTAGRFTNGVGREGGGPGEFEHITWAQKYRGDSILVFDRRLVRLSVFDSDGRLARMITPRDDQGQVITSAIGAFNDGTFMVVEEAVPEQSEPGVFRPVLTLFRADAEGNVGDRVGSYLGEESYLHVFRAGGAMDSPRLFAYTTEFALAGDRFYSGYTGDFEIRTHSETGRLLSAFRRGFQLLGVSPDDVSQLKAQRLESVRHIAHIRDRLGEFLDAMPLPASMPAFGPMLADDAGNLWVEEYLRPGVQVRRWTVFGPDGAVVAMLEGPDRFEPQHIGRDFLLGRWFDEQGEEHVRQYELIKG
jgi:hypothetical protein